MISTQCIVCVCFVCLWNCVLVNYSCCVCLWNCVLVNYSCFVCLWNCVLVNYSCFVCLCNCVLVNYSLITLPDDLVNPEPILVPIFPFSLLQRKQQQMDMTVRMRSRSMTSITRNINTPTGMARQVPSFEAADLGVVGSM